MYTCTMVYVIFLALILKGHISFNIHSDSYVLKKIKKGVMPEK